MGKAETTRNYTVVAKQPMRCRAGMQFTQSPREVDLTEDQAARIGGDALLVIYPTPPADEKRPKG